MRDRSHSVTKAGSATAWLLASVFILGQATNATPVRANEGSDRDAIVATMMATWDRPDAPLDAGPVAIEGDHAVADWTQGKTGGRALLKRTHGRWVTVLCAGDGIRSSEGLIEAGLGETQARALAESLARMEREVPAQRLALMASFRGIVRMDAHGVGHAPHP